MKPFTKEIEKDLQEQYLKGSDMDEIQSKLHSR